MKLSIYLAKNDPNPGNYILVSEAKMVGDINKFIENDILNICEDRENHVKN